MAVYDVFVALAMSIVMALVYARMGHVVKNRPVTMEARFARDSFSWWWYLLSIITAASAASAVLSAFEAWTLASFVVYTQVVLMIILVALAALLYYFTFLLTGRHGAWRPIATAYAAYGIAILYFLEVAQPIGIQYSRFGTNLAYANDITDSAFGLVLGVLLLVPVLVGALGYFSLYFKVEGRSQRFRIAMLAGAFVFWFGSSLVASYVLDVAGNPWWRIVSNLVALMASWAVYISYRPPRWLQARGIQGYTQRGEAEAK